MRTSAPPNRRSHRLRAPLRTKWLLLALLVACSPCFSSGGVLHGPRDASFFQSGTAYAIILQSHQIVIAADSRTTTTPTDNSPPKIRDGVDKVVSLDRRVCFFSAGLDRYYSAATGTNLDLNRLARHALAEEQPAGHPSLAALADSFGRMTSAGLEEIPAHELASLYQRVRKLGQPVLFEGVFAGVDADNQLKIARVIFSDRLKSGQPQWVVHPPVAADSSPALMLLGTVRVLQEALTDPNSAVARLPEFEAWRAALESHQELDPVASAAALVHLCLQYSSPEERAGLGYPIFVYRFTASRGLEKVLVVRATRPARLPQ